MKKTVCLVFLFTFFFSLLTIAGPVQPSQAESVARKFFRSHGGGNIAPTLTHQASLPSQDDRKSSVPAFYIFNFAEKGFVIVAADDRVEPVLGYSTESAFDAENIPENMQFLFNCYFSEIQAIINDDKTKEIRKWNDWQLRGAEEVGTVTAVVGPLITSRWHQQNPYNAFCPADGAGPGGHTLVGCGAIVMGQLLRYWRYPTSGSGTHSYNAYGYGTQSADFEDAIYDYDNMPDYLTSASPDLQINAVGTLLYHCGVSVNMNYGVNASYMNSNNMVPAMTNYWKYPETIQAFDREDFSSLAWWHLIKGELDDSAPFFYGGTGSQGGHVFLCDGYDEENYVHINWGFGGGYDGYFLVTALNPGPYSFSSEQVIIVGMRGPELPPQDTTSVSETMDFEVSVYPNPAREQVTVVAPDFGETGLVRCTISDLAGRVILSENFEISQNALSHTFNLSHISNGIYLLAIETNKRKTIRKVIVE